MIKYRPEIDGLRTIAVLAVILYHAKKTVSGYTLFPGGFIGVDVFFVISGYLISKIILRESKERTFNFLSFYQRRARRILPVLLTVFAVSSYFAWTLMLPKALLEFSGSLLSSLGFGSNIWFWLENSYTAEVSELKPLLHTWSLSVEEQFYIFFPPLVLIAYKYFRKYLLHVTLLLIVISLGVAEYLSYWHEDAGFYLLPSRGWELLAGTLLALMDGQAKYKFENMALKKVLPLLGMALIVGSLCLFDHSVRHPSLFTVIPILGTMLVIHFSHRADVVTNILSSRLFVKTGLISYSLYLWHVPIFAFAKIQNGDRVNEDMVRYMALTLILSILSYFIIEKPFRNKQRVKNIVFYPVMGIVAAILIGVNVYSLMNKGLPDRLDDHNIEILYGLSGQLATKDAHGKVCHERPHSDYCVLNKQGKNGTFILIGDSKAASVSSVVYQAAKDHDAKYIQLTRGSCLYMPGIRFKSRSEQDDCSLRSEDVPNVLNTAEKPVTIFYHSRIEKWLNRDALEPVNQEGTIEDEIQNTVNSWVNSGYRVVLLYPAPEPSEHIPRRVKRELAAIKEMPKEGSKLQTLDLSTSYGDFKAHANLAREIFDGIETTKNVIRIFPEKAFCSDEFDRCASHNEYELFYLDSHHLSIHGANKLYPLITEGLLKLDEVDNQ